MMRLSYSKRLLRQFAKTHDEARGIWQARVNRDWRFYFTIEGDEYHLQEIRPHPK
jgi:plasmid maintenance system killer protein